MTQNYINPWRADRFGTTRMRRLSLTQPAGSGSLKEPAQQAIEEAKSTASDAARDQGHHLRG